jgi:hypothetical protein
MNDTNGQLLIYIFWITSILCFFINIHLATIKGRKITTWLVLTLFFGVFATFMLLLANKEPESQSLSFN